MIISSRSSDLLDRFCDYENRLFGHERQYTGVELGMKKPKPTRKELWEDLAGCDCPPLGKGSSGFRVYAADRCTPRRVSCNGRLKRINRDYKKHGYTIGPPQ